MCKEAHDNYRNNYTMWIDKNKPKHNILFDLYEKSCSQFKYTLRACKQNKEQLIADNITSDLSKNDCTKFWNKVKSINKCGNSTAANINGVSGTKNIANMWKDRYSNLLNSCATTEEMKRDVEMLTSVDQEFHNDMSVTTEELEHAIKALKSGKSPDHDNLSSEHFQHALYKLIVILSICITCMFIHNYVLDEA